MTLTTIGETTFEFRFNKEKTFNYGGKNDVTLETEIFDVLVNGKETIYSVQFHTDTDSYWLWSDTPEKRGGSTLRELTPFGINGKSGFPISVVCDIVKEINK